MLAKLLCVAIGGAIGAVIRYLVGLWASQKLGSEFPWGTFIVNLTGCFFIGILVVLTTASPLNEYLKPLLIVGFLGALTTFSTFCFESFVELEKGNFFIPSMNIIGSCIAGLFFVFLGLRIGRVLFSVFSGTASEA